MSSLLPGFNVFGRRFFGYRLQAILLLSTLPLAGIAQSPIRSVETGRKCIALTFDDGPGKLTPRFLDVLQSEKVAATFFVIGSQLEDHAGTVRRTLTEGHDIGNHSMSHVHLDRLSAAEVNKEIEGVQLLSRKLFQFNPVLFRAPYLKHNEIVWNCVDEHDLTSIGASVIAYDWGENFTEQTVFRNAVKDARPGSIVLMHEREQTLKALPEIIRFYRDSGYEFITVSELLASEQIGE